MNVRRSVLSIVLTSWAILQTGELSADGLIRDGVGAISTGRGGTNLAHSDNGAILLDNPAGMVNVAGCGLYEIGLDTVFCDLDYSDLDAGNGHIQNEFKPVPSPELAFIQKDSTDRWAMGIGAFVPAGFGANYDMNNPVTGQDLYKSLGGLAKVLGGVAYRITDDLSIGGSFGVAITHVELEGPFYLQSGPLAGAPTSFDLQGTDATWTGSLGLQYKWTESTTFGVCYTEESRFTIDGNLRADLIPLAMSSEFDAQIDLVWPRSLGLGVKHDLSCCHRVSADVIWYDWSHAFDRLDITLTNASNPALAAFGPVIRDTLPLDWSDSVSLRLGYEWDTSDLDTWRIGYVFHESPVPDSTLNPYLDGVLEHAFSVGYSRQQAKYILNLAYQYSFGAERYVEDSEIAGGDFDNSSFQAQAHWVSVGVTVPF